MLRPKLDHLPYADIEERLAEIRATNLHSSWSNASLHDLGQAHPPLPRRRRLAAFIKRLPVIGKVAARLAPYAHPRTLRTLLVAQLRRFPLAFRLAQWGYQLLTAPQRQQDLHQLLLAINHRTSMLEQQQRMMETHMQHLHQSAQQHEDSIGHLRKDLQRLEDIMRLQPASHTAATSPSIGSSRTASTAPASPFVKAALDRFYKAFEDQFRGSESEISQRLHAAYGRYLDTLPPNALALDLGCGRGEWLKLLQRKGIQGKGVDLTASMVRYCATQGLDVTQGDASQYLGSLAPDSLHLISAFHVAEHLPFPQLIELIVLARRALRPGGILILETPNPENLQVGANTFYMDPTHLHPLPPALLAFAAQSQGFAKTHIERLHPCKQINDQSNTTDKLLYGPQDYALIAWK